MMSKPQDRQHGIERHRERQKLDTARPIHYVQDTELEGASIHAFFWHFIIQKTPSRKPHLLLGLFFFSLDSHDRHATRLSPSLQRAHTSYLFSRGVLGVVGVWKPGGRRTHTHT